MKDWMIKHKTGLIVGAFIALIIGVVLYNKRQQSLLETGGLEANFEVSGKIADAAGLMLFIEAPSDKGTIPVAEGQINDDGTFEIKGNVPGLGYYFLRLNDEQNSLIPIN